MSLIERAMEQRLKAERLEIITPEPMPPEPSENEVPAPPPDAQPSAEARGPQAGTAAEAPQAERLPEDEDKAHRPRAHVDVEKLASQGYLTPGHTGGPLAEEIRRIKRPLLDRATHRAQSDGHANIVLVTSSVPDEGKTWVSINLAMSICSEVDRTVLLVDADTRRSCVSERLGLAPAVGLVEVLRGDCELGDAILPTDIPTLSVLPAGTATNGADELFASNHMAAVLAEVSRRYSDRVILIDSPPVLAASESVVLARQSGTVLVVVRADSTSHAQLSACLDMLSDVGDIALVLNQASRSIGDSTPYYQYYNAVTPSPKDEPVPTAEAVTNSR